MYPVHLGVRDSVLIYLSLSCLRFELLCSLGKTLLSAKARVDALMRSRMWATASRQKIERIGIPR